MSSAGPVALIGGLEHTAGCEPIDSYLMEIIGVRRPTVVVMPAASRDRMVPVASERALRYWSRLGGKVRVALAGRDSDATVVTALDGADIIVLTGGQSDLIRMNLHGSPVWTRTAELWAQGAALAGSSMGMIELFERRFKMWPPRPLSLIEGLGLVGGHVGVPHFDRYGLARWSRIVSRRLSGTGILGVDERTGVIGRDGEMTVVGCGSASLVVDGVVARFPANSDFRLPPVLVGAPSTVAIEAGDPPTEQSLLTSS